MIFSLYFRIIVSVLITIIIDSFFIKYIKSKESLLSILMGYLITTIGLFTFYLVYTTRFYTKYGSIPPYFIATYMITTGLFMSLIGYTKNSK